MKAPVMIEFNVSELLKEPVGSNRDYKLNEGTPSGSLEEDRIHNIDGVLSLTRTNRGVLVFGDMESTVTCTCSRCLSSYNERVSFNIEEEFLPSTNVKSGVPGDLSDVDDPNVIIKENHLLNLTEHIRQQSIISLPMKPLCDLDCRGICSGCGTNLMQGKCICQKDKRDPRWGVLLDLKLD